jgi:hypothetical protein
MQTICVTAFDDDNNEIEGALCSLVNNRGSWSLTTPGSALVHKSYGDMVVTCKKEGYVTGHVTLVSKNNAEIWGNIIAGGLVGYAIDISTGSGFNYKTNIKIKMKKEPLEDSQELKVPLEPLGLSSTEKP